ncbi:DUF4157 domain-containing protein [Floridanema aerugineum]|uniref:DUF4157 domain-containing protein n=1 Tax=Floridaenema aerugineum BLCC-F46 TaxID=3153654 RepID=A0ABV4XFJ9_9CYAN
MADSNSSPTIETPKATSAANPPVQDINMTAESESDRTEIMSDRIVRTVGGSSPQTPPNQFTGSLKQLPSSSQVGMLRQLQRGYGNSYVGNVIQAKLTVGQPGDVYEQEAERVADTVMQISQSEATVGAGIKNQVQPMRIQRMCAECAKEEEEKIDPKESPGQTPTVTPALETRLDRTRGGGEPLPESVRSFMEPQLGADFSGVRVHTGSQASSLNRELGAQAFTRQRDIYFGVGQYTPETVEGQRLLAHELTHVVQQSGSDGQIQRLCGVDESCPEEMMGSNVSSSADMMSVDAQRHIPIPVETGQLPQIGDDADLETQVASFKRLVLTTARTRLASNRVNLAEWRAVVEDLQLNRQQQLAIQVAQLQETVERRSGFGQSALEQYLIERNPIRRETRLHQVEGRYIACTGCHAEQWATRLEHETPAFMRTGPEWQPVANQLTGVESRNQQYLEPWLAVHSMPNLLASEPQVFSEQEVIRQWLEESSVESLTARDNTTTTTPSRNSSARPEHEVTQNFDFQEAPNQDQMERINAITESYRTIIEALGPEGYQVWTDSAISWNSENIESVRQGILSRIDQRRSDYLELIRKITTGEIEYIHFMPILQDLLPFASSTVREVIQAEIDAQEDKQFWEKIIVGAASLILLLLILFPPTAIIGATATAALTAGLELGLGAYGVYRGPQMIQTGRAYQLGTGANDVFTPEQQSAGNALVFSGFLNIIGGGLNWASGWWRTAGLSSRLLQSSIAAERTTTGLLTSGSQTIQRGQFLLTLERDAIVASVANRPDLLIIVRGNTATMYQRLAGGAGLRIVEQRTISTFTSSATVESSTSTASGTSIVPWSGISSRPVQGFTLPGEISSSSPLLTLPDEAGVVSSLATGGATPTTSLRLPPRWLGGRILGRLGEVTRFEEIGLYPGRMTQLFAQTQRIQIYNALENGTLSLRDFGRMVGTDGVEQMYFRTPSGGRFIDHVFPEGEFIILRESKNVRDFAITEDIYIQLSKDIYLLNRYPEAIVEWRISGNGMIDSEAYDLLEAISERMGGRFRFQLQDSARPPIDITLPPTLH